MEEIPFFRHDLGRAELDALAEVIAGPILTTGEWVERFETRFAEYLGCRRSVGVTSCTAALHLALVDLGIGPGDEVVTTPLTFIATATAIEQAGATPVFADVEPETGNLDAAAVAAAIGPRTRAILPVHLYGQMCDMRALHALAGRHGLALVEDAAHCVEGERDGVRPGGLSDAACFSFYATKNLTCGEGGAIATRDEARAERLKRLRLHGMEKTGTDRFREGYRHWDMPAFGWKYNMDNFDAALLLPQLDRVEENLRRREAVAARYTEQLSGVDGITLPAVVSGSRHARHLFPVWVAPERRDAVIAGMQAARIAVVVNYRAIHLLTYFRTRYGLDRGSFPVAERLGDSAISLPFFPGLQPEQVGRVAQTLRELVAG